MLRVNVGCGPSPTPGWTNVDNSPSVMLRALPVGRLLGPNRRAVWKAARDAGVRYGRASRLPFSNASVDVIYASHMFEHLSRGGARSFLGECRRVLVPGGVLRLAVPDLSLLVARYRSERDADAFVASTMLVDERRGFGRMVRFVGHRWMYDGPSLRLCVESAGFVEPRLLQPGETTIPDPGQLNLRERESETAYLEAKAPAISSQS